MYAYLATKITIYLSSYNCTLFIKLSTIIEKKNRIRKESRYTFPELKFDTATYYLILFIIYIDSFVSVSLKINFLITHSV